MKLDLNSQTLNVSFACRIEDAWVPVPETACTQSGFDWTLNGAHYSAQFTPLAIRCATPCKWMRPTPPSCACGWLCRGRAIISM